MKTRTLTFSKDSEGQYVTDIVTPGRINVYVKLQGPGSIKAKAVVDGITEPIEVGTSEYCETPVLDINLIAGTKIRLITLREVSEAAYITEESDEE